MQNIENPMVETADDTIDELIASMVRDIRGVCEPRRIILYAEKRTMATGKLKALSLCVIVKEGANCQELRPKLHLALTAAVPVSLSVYTSSEWKNLLTDEGSYAAWIARKGQAVYESET